MTFVDVEIARAKEALVAQACGALASMCQVFDRGYAVDLERGAGGETIIYRFQDQILTMTDARKAYRAFMEGPIDSPDFLPAMSAAIQPLAALADACEACEDDGILVSDHWDDPVITVAHVRAAAKAQEPISYSEALRINRAA